MQVGQYLCLLSTWVWAGLEVSPSLRLRAKRQNFLKSHEKRSTRNKNIFQPAKCLQIHPTAQPWRRTAGLLSARLLSSLSRAYTNLSSDDMMFNVPSLRIARSHDMMFDVPSLRIAH